MANTRYPLGLKALADGDVDLLADTISLQMYEGAAVYDAAHDFLSDVAGSKAGAAVTLTGKDTTAGKLTATVGSFLPATGLTIVAVVLYKDTGVDGTSQLLAWIDSRADGTPLALLTNGGVINLNWTGPIFSLGGT